PLPLSPYTTLFRSPTGAYLRRAKDRMVRDGVPLRETVVIHRTDAANCAYVPPVTGHSCVVDHTERINRSFLRWHRFVYSVCSGESRLGNDRRGLYQHPWKK